MTTKLTLTVKKDIIESAKVYAKQNGRSLSALIENYLKALVQKENTEEDFSPKVKELMGSIKLPKDFDYKKELTEAFSKIFQMINFFLDTNIVIDFLTDRKPFSSLAGKLFDYSEKGEVKLYLSAVSYRNIYYVVRKVSSYKETIKILSRLEEMTEIIDTTSSTIKNAIDSEFKDFEDALQYYSAKLNKNINGIVTRNGGDFKHSTISILTPEEAIRFVESASR